MNIRVGFGYDVHQLAEGLKLVLGGVALPHTKGCVAHSDGDALIHAICDALLGAAGLRDIGHQFPDTSLEFKGIDSKILLARTASLLRAEGWEIGNIDATLCLERPRIKPHIDEMLEAMAGAAGISAGQISVKATTNEKMGFVGREDGVAAYAVALITKIG